MAKRTTERSTKQVVRSGALVLVVGLIAGALALLFYGAYFVVYLPYHDRAEWIRLAETSPSPDIRAQAVGHALSSYHGRFKPEVNLGLGLLKDDPSPEVRSAAAREFLLFARIGNKRVIEALIWALENDPDEGVRQTAAESLGGARSLDAVAALAQAAAEDPAERVRFSADSVLYELAGGDEKWQVIPEDWSEWFKQHKDTIRWRADGRLEW